MKRLFSIAAILSFIVTIFCLSGCIGDDKEDSSYQENIKIKEDEDFFSRSEPSSSADVPDFLKTTGNVVNFTGTQIITKNGKETTNKSAGNYINYVYECSIDDDDNFAEKYVELLSSRYSFTQIKYFENDYIKTSARKYENWGFDYNGTKHVDTFKLKDFARKSEYDAAISVTKVSYYDSGISKFIIRISTDLDYDGDYVEEERHPSSSNRNEEERVETPTYNDNTLLFKECSNCRGRGKITCTACDGKGGREVRKSVPNYSGSLEGPENYTVIDPCAICAGRGEVTCPYCGGTGKVR